MELCDAFGTKLKEGDEVYAVEQWDNSTSVKKIVRLICPGDWARVHMKHVTYRDGINPHYNNFKGTCWSDAKRKNGRMIFKRLIKKAN